MKCKNTNIFYDMELSGLLLNKFMPKKIVFLFFLTLYVVFLFVIFSVGACVRSGLFVL